MLKDLLSNGDDALVVLYKPTCPYCRRYLPKHNHVASVVHATNRVEGNAAIVVAKMDITDEDARAAVEAILPGQVATVPFVLLKRGGDGATRVVNGEERESSDFYSILADFFDDASLLPIGGVELHELCKAQKPTMALFYVGGDVLRRSMGAKPDPSNMLALNDACVAELVARPHLHASTRAFDVQKAKWRHIPFPCVVVAADGSNFRFAEALEYLQSLPMAPS